MSLIFLRSIYIQQNIFLQLCLTEQRMSVHYLLNRQIKTNRQSSIKKMILKIYFSFTFNIKKIVVSFCRNMHIFFIKERSSLQKILFMQTHLSLFSNHERLNYLCTRSFFLKKSSVFYKIFRLLRKKSFVQGKDAQAYRQLISRYNNSLVINQLCFIYPFNKFTIHIYLS